jgi:hypothetical protein
LALKKVLAGFSVVGLNLILKISKLAILILIRKLKEHSSLI